MNGKVQIAIELEDASDKPAVVKVTADSVLVRVTVNVTSNRLTEELLALMSKVRGRQLYRQAYTVVGWEAVPVTTRCHLGAAVRSVPR